MYSKYVMYSRDSGRISVSYWVILLRDKSILVLPPAHVTKSANDDKNKNVHKLEKLSYARASNYFLITVR